MEIKVFVDIPALDHLAEALSCMIANPKEVPAHTEMNTSSAVASSTEPVVAMPAPELGVAAPVPVQTNTAPAVPVQTNTVPTAPVSSGTSATYTRDQLAKAATDHLMPQRMQELTNLLANFGVKSLMDLPENRFGEFATALRGLGAKI